MYQVGTIPGIRCWIEQKCQGSYILVGADGPQSGVWQCQALSSWRKWRWVRGGEWRGLLQLGGGRASLVRWQFGEAWGSHCCWGAGAPVSLLGAPLPPAFAHAPSHSLSGSRGHLLCDRPWVGGGGQPGGEPHRRRRSSWRAKLGSSCVWSCCSDSRLPGGPWPTGDAAGSKGAPSPACGQVIRVTGCPE